MLVTSSKHEHIYLIAQSRRAGCCCGPDMNPVERRLVLRSREELFLDQVLIKWLA
jgi:hypothetical protein